MLLHSESSSSVCRCSLYFTVLLIITSEYEVLVGSNQHFSNDHIKRQLEKAFIRLARDEMGVIAMQTAFDGLKYEKLSTVNLTQSLDILTSQLTRRLRDYTHIVTSTRNMAVRLYRSHKDTPLTPRFDCCNLFERDLRLDLVYGCRISRRECCDLIPRSLPATAFNPGHNLTRRFQQQLDYWPNVKWFFFITSDGLHTEYPAHNFQCTTPHHRDYTTDNRPIDATYFGDSSIFGANGGSGGASSLNSRLYQEKHHHHHQKQLKQSISFSSVTNPFHCHNLHQFRHRSAFIRSILPKPIWMTIILDQGEASQTQLLLGQRVARILLASLSEKDYVNVLLVSDNVLYGLEYNSNNNQNKSDASKLLNSTIQTPFQNKQLFNISSEEFVFNSQEKNQTLGYAYKATEEMKAYMDRFIHSVNRPLPVKTNHIKAFYYAFQTIISNMKRFQSEKNQFNSIGIPEHIMLAYISRGYLTDLTEASTTLRLVSTYQAHLNNSVHICTYMPTEEKSTTVLFEQTFMKDLATRWSFYSTSNTSIELNKLYPPKQGHFFPINRTTDLSNTVGKFYEIFLKPTTINISDYQMVTKSTGNIIKPLIISSATEDVTIEIEHDLSDTTASHDENDKLKPVELNVSSSSHEPSPEINDLKSERLPESFPVQYSLPYYDLEGGDLVVTISQAFTDQDNLIGVMGIDVHLLDLVDNFVHFTTSGAIDGGSDSSVAFLLQSPDGYTLSHPTLTDTLIKHYHLRRRYYEQNVYTDRHNAYASNNHRNQWINHRNRRHFGEIRNPSSYQTVFTSSGIDSRSSSSNNGRNCLLSARNIPNFRESRQQQEPILNPDISRLEWVPGFQSLVRHRLLNELSGEVGLLVKLTRSEMEVYGLTGIINTCFNTTRTTADSNNDKLPIHVVYRWKRIHELNTPYIVVVRSVQSLCSEYRQLSPLVPEFDFHYHRLDLLKEPQKCLFLNQLISFSFGTVYLSPRAFARPFTRLTQGYLEDINDIRHLVAYLFDHTVLISDPGLAGSSATTSSSSSASTGSSPSIRSSVAIVERIGKFWMHRSHVSELRDFIIRRYVATNTGAMLVYPGTLLSHTYDPSNRIWYKRALAMPGRLVATGPYLDDGGAGYIITLSRTIFEGNYTGVRVHGNDKVAAVIGMDVTYRFLSLMLFNWLPECEMFLKQENLFSSTTSASNNSSLILEQQLEKVMNKLAILLGGDSSDSTSSTKDDLRTLDNLKRNKKKVSVQQSNLSSNNKNNNDINHDGDDDINAQAKNPIHSRCLLMDDRGYLLAHPSFYEPKLGGPLEQNHLSYHEPIVASDLLNNENVFQKTVCLNYNKRTLQRQYKFNLSITDPIKNSMSGEQCVEYQLSVIPETNLIFGLIKEHHRFGCSPRTGFCPCSTKNRLCLNCGRIEPRECECPCQCPIELDQNYWVNNPIQEHNEDIYAYQTVLKTSNLNHTVYSVEKKKLRFTKKHANKTGSLLDESQPETSAFKTVYSYPPCLQTLEMEPVSAVSYHFDPYIFTTSSVSSFHKINEVPPCPMNNEHFMSNEHIISDQNQLDHQRQHQQQHESMEEVNPEHTDHAYINQQINYGANNNNYHNQHANDEQPLSRCSQRSRLTCSSTVGCEWCMMTLNNEQLLEHPFCAPISVCFNGVVGVNTPNSNYGPYESDFSPLDNNVNNPNSYTYAIRSRQESLELKKFSEFQSKISSLSKSQVLEDSSTVHDGRVLPASLPILHSHSSSVAETSHSMPNSPISVYNRKVSHDLLALFSRHSEKMSSRKIISADFYPDLYNSLKLLSSSNNNNNNNGVDENDEFIRQYPHSFIITNPVGSVIGGVLVTFIIFLLIIYTIKYRRRLRERFMPNCLNAGNRVVNVLPPLESEAEAVSLNTSSVNSHCDKYSSNNQQKSDPTDQCPRFNQHLDSNNNQSQPPPPPPPAPALVCISNESVDDGDNDEEGTTCVNSSDEQPSSTGIGPSDTESTSQVYENQQLGNSANQSSVIAAAASSSSTTTNTTTTTDNIEMSSMNKYPESTILSPYWIVENCLQKVEYLMNTYEMHTMNHQTMFGSELSKLHSELLLSKDRLCATNCTIPPNPYHTNSLTNSTSTVQVGSGGGDGLPTTQLTPGGYCNVLLSSQHTESLPYDQPSEFGDSAVGSDCATAPSCASSSSSSNMKHVCSKTKNTFENDCCLHEQYQQHHQQHQQGKSQHQRIGASGKAYKISNS
ncbi:unnamed protein product [Trichobilharzia szidati]|nr:unnamed protein product [Trichobilharzia szidati]